MLIQDCIRQLESLGYTVEEDPRAGREGCWLLFSPVGCSGSGEPDFFDSEALICWSQRFLIPLHIDDR
ncbi:hypothetical protein XhhCFBP4925_23360 [Xanthomonas hortorum pv. hederae]|nr:hypothetical protein XhhCFBP4925_23360 [Xanthomonas hortorum pv. hederae]PUE91091.1 hypothetical protein C7T87_24280 [Xanthomonas hortorum pv. hederae]